MRNLILLLCCVFGIASSARAQTPVDLTATHTVTAGDYAALLLSEAIKLQTEIATLDANAFVMFNPVNMQVIDIQLVGSKSGVEEARAAVEKIVKWIEKDAIRLLEQHMKISITRDSFRIYYYDRSAAEPRRLVLAWVKGEYAIPDR